MPALTKCPDCGLELGQYVETRCPQCGGDFTPRLPVTFGIRLLDLLIAVSGALLVFASIFAFTSYMNSSSRAELYRGAPYHPTTFRVTSVHYEHRITYDAEGGASTQIIAFAMGVVEGQKESMDLLSYIVPRNQKQLEKVFPPGTVVPVYLFPTLEGENRIRRVSGVPTAERYQQQVTWVTNRVLPVVGVLAILTALLVFARLSISRNQRRELMANG